MENISACIVVVRQVVIVSFTSSKVDTCMGACLCVGRRGDKCTAPDL